MGNADIQLVKTLRIIALSIGAFIALLLPVGYWVLTYNASTAQMVVEARVNANLVSEIVNANPLMWQFEEHRLQAQIDNDSSENDLLEARRIHDARGRVLIENTGILPAPTISRSEDFFDSGRPVGSVEIERSLLPVVFRTIGVAVIGILLGAAVYVVLLVLPIRALERALAALRHEKERLRVVVDNANDAIITVDQNLFIEAFNPAAEKMFGYPAIDMLKQSVGRLVPQFAAVSGRATVLDFSDQHQTDTTGCRRDGSTFPLEFDKIRARLSGDEKFILTLRDITARKFSEQRLSVLANYDSLTSLPNRSLFRDRLHQSMLRAQRNNKLLGLMFLDLDRFKTINDSLGHGAGDQLLQHVAERLKHTLRSSDIVSIISGQSIAPERDIDTVTVSRIGGDEFTVIIEDLHLVDQVATVAQKIVEVFTRPFNISGHQIYTSASVGITIYPFDDETIDGLIKSADTAMYRAKEHGRNTYQFFTADMNTRAGERLAFETSLRAALEQEQFVLHYQPKLDLVRNTIVGFEALLRWQHPEHGLIPPGEFIPLLEETGLIVPVGEWVIRKACAQAMAWQHASRQPVSMAVNLSARQFKLPGLAERVATILKETGLDPASLELEMTEGLLMENTESSTVTLGQLESMGIKISIDDFGTGYSSLAYLKRFPIGVLKIDRSFVRDVTTDPEDAAIARAIIALAHSLNLEVVAEGVETTEQLTFLRAHGCDVAQGFLISRPMDAAAALQWLGTQQNSLASGSS